MSARTEDRRADRRLSEAAITILEALLIALVIRNLLFQSFDIPSTNAMFG